MTSAILNPKRREPDLLLLVPAVALAVVGVLFVFSATEESSQDLPLLQQKYFQQILWVLGGILAAVAVNLLDYSKVARWSRVIYWGSILSLVAVLMYGSVHYGGKRWLWRFQPTEFAKLAFILALADYLSRPEDELKRPRVFMTALGMTALPFVLIMKEPDLGSALVFVSVSLAMLFVAGVPGKFMRRLAGYAGTPLALVLALTLFAPDKVSIIKPYQRLRLLSYFGMVDRKDREAADYNVKQSLISVGSGGLWGKGWRQGNWHKLDFLPPIGALNDFIFSVVAEEEGFVGSVGVLALYAALLFSGLKIASQARDRLGQLLAAGVVTMLFSHVFINIGMNIRLMPVAGIPLPLVSYGGSSVVCSLVAIGLLHNIHLYRKSY